jgi:exodeoxyribonuclease V alpha subunit
VDGTPFRTGDKVVCLRNGYYASIHAGETNDDGEAFVANGEVGRVREINLKSIEVELESPNRLIRVPRGKGEGANSGTGFQWDLAYALSVHKFQGSEQRVVIVALDASYGAKMLCDRSWIYTAISRAKDQCFLVGAASTAERMCRIQRIDLRKTFLADRITRRRYELAFDGI